MTGGLETPALWPDDPSSLSNARASQSPRKPGRSSRSPHPYESRRPGRPGSSDEPNSHTDIDGHGLKHSQSQASSEREDLGHEDSDGRLRRKSSIFPSESGSEADDESPTFLKGLPAPPMVPRKGLRGSAHEGTPSPLSTPGPLSESNRSLSAELRSARLDRSGLGSEAPAETRKARKQAELLTRKRRAELLRRSIEVVLVGLLGWAVVRDKDAWRQASGMSRELVGQLWVVASLLLWYPVRLLYHACRSSSGRQLALAKAFRLPSAFDPAPLLYPATLPVYVALSIASSDKPLVLSNIILSLSSIPDRLIPDHHRHGCYSTVHWCLATLPAMAATRVSSHSPTSPAASLSGHAAMQRSEGETLSILYPVHRVLVALLQQLASTSLLPAETHLLSVGLINSLLHSRSPQAVVLKALLWGGGLGILVLCGSVLRWGLVLARIPRWRFRRAGQVVSARNALLDLLRRRRARAGDQGSDADEDGPPGIRRRRRGASHFVSPTASSLKGPTLAADRFKAVHSSQTGRKHADGTREASPGLSFLPSRKRTASAAGSEALRTPRALDGDSGRRLRRSTSSAVQTYLAMTPAQAAIRKWLYATYVYVATLLVAFVGIRTYVGKHALGGREPVGWAIGYLFGDIPWLRDLVKQWGQTDWICLPSEETPTTPPLSRSTSPGIAEHVRHSLLGPANTRLVIIGYCLAILAAGLTLVIRLSGTVEVDTRRKVFHGTMVAMFLPVTFVDPVFAGLAMALVLAIFLILDVFRTCQLPPISKPLAYFLTPYVDGRDLRGPVVISHIFLLVGCAVPLWLSLAGAGAGVGHTTGEHQRSQHGPPPPPPPPPPPSSSPSPSPSSPSPPFRQERHNSCWLGWDVPVRDLGMVSGVICVGMGDAAASLVGRRFGRRKWPWSGGKSLEGSLAFSTAVLAGLFVSKLWLLLGEWPTTSEHLANQSIHDHHHHHLSSRSSNYATFTNQSVALPPSSSSSPFFFSTSSFSTEYVAKACLAAIGASLTEAVLTGGNDNVIVPVVLWLLVRGLNI